MAKPCKYRLPGQETWMSEDDFKKSLADGLLDKFILDDKASIPSLRGFKADATSAQKFRAPVAETAPTTTGTPQAEVTPTPVAETKAELIDVDSKLQKEQIEAFRLSDRGWRHWPKMKKFSQRIKNALYKNGYDAALAEGEAIKQEIEEGGKLKLKSKNPAIEILNALDRYEGSFEKNNLSKEFKEIMPQLESNKISIDDIPDSFFESSSLVGKKSASTEFDSSTGDEIIKAGDLITAEKIKKLIASGANNINTLKTEGKTDAEIRAAGFEKISKENNLFLPEKKQQPAPTTETKAEPTAKAEPKPTTTTTETKPTTDKVERKGAVEVEAETKRGVNVTYKAEISEDGKTATVQSTAEAPFGGEATNPKITNLPIKTDSRGNRYVETPKSETKVYIDKVKEAPKSKEAPVKEEVQGKGQPTKVKIYAREPKLDDRGMPIISKFNQEVEFTKNKRTGKWETTDKAGNKIEATEDQAARADKALTEQPKTTKEKISDAFDKLKIDPKGKLFSIPIPVDLYNKIVELAKRFVLAGVDVTTAINRATNQVIEKRKAQKLISDAEAKKVQDYTNSKEFTDKINEAVEGEGRVSGIKRALTSKEAQEIAEGQIERMTIKEALDTGEAAIKNGDVVPDKLITSIIGGKNPRTGQYQNGVARPLTAIETAAMVYHKASLDNELENAYNDLNKALDSKNIIDQDHAKSEIARLEEKIAEYEVMANVTAYQQGLSLKLRSMMLNSEYDLVKQKAKIRAEYGGKIPADVEERLNELDKQLREANAKLAELEKKRTKAEDEEVVKNIKETKDTENKSAVSKDGKIKIPTADIRQAVLNGATTIDEVVNAVRDSVKAKFPKATDRQIRDAITNYGKSRTETKDAIQKKINEMKRVGRLLSELEDVQNGIKKTKNQIKRDALTQRETELKQKIKEELAKIPLTDEEIAELQAEKLERFKKTSQKAIQELQKKIDNGDFEKKKRDPLLDLDKEAADLRSKREEVKYKFDLEFEKAQRNRMTIMERIGEQFIKSLSASKSLIASLDFSAPLRQGSVFVLSQNPKKTLSQLGKQFEFWWSEKSYNQWLNGIKSSEYYPLLKASGLYIAEENAKLTAAEEAFMNNFMTKVPLIGKTKVLKSGKKLWGADIYGRAERAYTGFLNNLRVQAFLDVAEKMSESGISPKTNIDEFKSWADYVNNATGRGTAGKKNLIGRGFEASAPGLSLFFFSPRFLWSRLNLTGINPSMYYRMSPTARKHAIKRTIAYAGAATTILGLTALYLNNDDDDETSVETDPKSSDFAKIKIGNTRIDILAGNQQVIRTIAQAYSGERKKTTTGEIEKLGEKYGSQTRGGVVGNFFVNKFSPIASTLYKRYALTEPEQKMREEEGEGASDMKSIVADLTIPLYLQDVKDLSKDHGAAGALGFTLLSVFGLGVQNMQPKQKSIQQSTPMDDFEKSLYEDDSYTDFEKQEQKMLEGF